MRRIAEGDEAAIAEVAGKYTGHILRVVRRILPDAMRRRFDSQDFAQTVWRVMFQERQRFAQFSDPDDLIGFLVIASRNRVLTERRKQLGAQSRDLRREVELRSESGDQCAVSRIPTLNGLPSDCETPSQIVTGREAMTCAFESLGPREREIFALMMQGFSTQEISEQVGTSGRTVRRTLAEIRERLGVEQ